MPLNGGKYFQIAAFFLNKLTLGKGQRNLIQLGRLGSYVGAYGQKMTYRVGKILKIASVTVVLKVWIF
jgi:hypothetical protein